jgi:predicted transcriptional regulator
VERPPVGDQELALLRFVAEQGPLSVGAVVESFGVEQGWARSTVLTVMERLRRKGYLVRRRVEGVFRYSSPLGEDELLRGVVRSFVTTTLGGSTSPFVGFLVERADVSDDELEQLQQLVRRLERRRGQGQPKEGQR